jgi:glutaredoxin
VITVYSKPNCQFCEQAKTLLNTTQHEYEIVNLDVGQTHKYGEKYISRDDLLTLIPNARTMPQIMQDGELIGGYTDLRDWLISK